ncbi:hypothetical protein SteCoe_24766 [Stentor coeruleus]|uniref:G-protein coupled receptors family 2 profile 2 domain-containing protein n=1 Tax=Stentor coeruleus TaxID=5963 RepID=A0A1R2BGR8_9CILI|nr:hypothetical protein SteCoe_24766 [Stentor coeruleus]
MGYEPYSARVGAFYTFFASNLISTIFCVFSVVIYLIAKPLRVYAFKLVFCLNLFDLLRSFIQLIPSIYLDIPDHLCMACGIIQTFSSFQCNYWTLVIAITIYKVIVEKKNNVDKDFPLWFWTGLISDLILVLIPIPLNLYGNVGGDCSLKTDLLGTVFKFIIFFGSGVLITFINFWIFYRIYKKLKSSNLKDDIDESHVKKLFYYPVILVLTAWPACILRIVESFEIYSTPLLYIAYLTWGLQGFFNSLAYTLTLPVKKYIISLFYRKKCSELTYTQLMNCSFQSK